MVGCICLTLSILIFLSIYPSFFMDSISSLSFYIHSFLMIMMMILTKLILTHILISFHQMSQVVAWLHGVLPNHWLADECVAFLTAARPSQLHVRHSSTLSPGIHSTGNSTRVLRVVKKCQNFREWRMDFIVVCKEER